jgi:hypothetical protein
MAVRSSSPGAGGAHEVYIPAELQEAGYGVVQTPNCMSRAVMEESHTNRARLLTIVLGAAQAAAGLPGVLRIGLIGSLTTNKPEPKDADLLITVSDDCDLSALAAAGRRVQGRAMSFGRGGEIFLCNAQGHYLGRTCPWKQCAPGIRARCDALHCGARPYLHDDLESITLAEALMAEPPIELWPEFRARVPVPEDVERLLLRPFQHAQTAMQRRDSERRTARPEEMVNERCT